MISSIALVLAFACSEPSLSAPASSDAQVKWEAPKAFMEGAAHMVHLEVTASKDGGSLPEWALGAGAFELDGKALGERGSGKIELQPGQKIVTDFDIGPALTKTKVEAGKPHKLALASKIGEAPAIDLTFLQGVEQGLDFMKMEPAELAKYHVYLATNRGNMEIEFWPDVAPGVVRNFLDLCYTKFYDGLVFHRVMPGFMIQGGDPNGNGTGNGPRTLKDEFSTRKHERGVISMASSGPNTASSQFFIMHATYPSLDGKYNCFGKLVSGFEALDKIANAPGTPIPGAGGNRPTEPQKILWARVIRAAK